MGNDISVLIIEDEEIWQMNLRLSLDDFGFETAGIASTTEEALEAFRTLDFDLALLDIHLNGRNSGMDLGKMLSTVYKKPFIFVTASTESPNISETVAAGPSAYLIKPINSSSLYIAIQNAIRNFSQQKTASLQDDLADQSSSFFVKLGNKYRKVDWNDVVYLVSGKNYISLFSAADETEYHIRGSLQKALQYIIPQNLHSRFLQVNRSEVVQTSFIQEINGEEILTPYRKFVVSEGFSKDVKKRLNILT